MRKLALLTWLLLPVLAGAYHYGPGQERLKLDDASTALKLADAAVARGDQESAILHYDDALGFLPAEKIDEIRRIRLEKNKAQMEAKQLPVAHAELKGLVDELVADGKGDTKIANEARAALANSQYYLTWLMRLEGVGREQWEPEIEAARQSLKLLADNAEESGDKKSARTHSEDLESVVRLARMDLKELQGLPLPSQ
jgi:hypothetical protein